MEICIRFASFFVHVVVLVLVLLFFCTREVLCHSGAAEKVAFNVTCDPNFNGTICHGDSLEEIVDEAKKKTISDLEIRIKIPQLQLNKILHSTNLRSLIIRGEDELGMTNLVCTQTHAYGSQAGIVINGIKESVLLQNLNLSFCGVKISNTFGKSSSKFYMYRALTIDQCKNVELKNIVIERSKGLGLVMNSNQGGHVIMTSILFQGNSMYNLRGVDDKAFGGGGAYITLGRSPANQSALRTFLFRNCTFKNNTAHTNNYTFVLNLRSGYGRGGGLYMYISGGLKNVFVSFIACKFISNRAFIGGGLSVKIQSRRGHVMQNIKVKIVDTLFQWNGYGGKNNSDNHTGLGGGLHVAFNRLDSVGNISNTSYHPQNVSFSNNYAELGGAVFYFSYRENQEKFSNANSMRFDNCTFISNRAHMGSAVAMIPYVFQKLSNGFIIVPKFLDCTFSRNAVFVKSSFEHRIGGIGTIYTSFYDIHFEGRNSFHSNHGTPIHAVNAIINFTNSDMCFLKNRGINGGALGLIGSSIVIFGPKSYNFTNNSALYRGGAVYVSLIDSTDFLSSRSCFFQYQDQRGFRGSWNASINFIGNKAKDETAGHAIYATSILPCQVVKQIDMNETQYHYLVNLTKIFDVRNFKFDSSAFRQPQIATDGAKLSRNEHSPLSIIPGQEREHGVVITDDLGHKVKASFRVNSNRYNGIKLESTSAFIGEKIRLRGTPHRNGSIYLQLASPRQSYILLDVKLLDCPPGFKFDNQSSTCVCDVDVLLSVTRCDLDTFHSYILPGFWIGVVKKSNEEKLVTGRCPFCDYSKQNNMSAAPEYGIILPQNYSGLNKAVCGDTRTGVLCGKCEDSYTVHFHSPGFLCKPAEPLGCRLGWLFYILSELIPVTVVFITVLVLNISFTSGAINGFILFSQLLDTFDIDASGIISYPQSAKHTIRAWIQRYRFIYGFFNLDFFDLESLSFCMMKNASALDMLALKYVTIFYTLLLIVAVILIMNKCGGRCCGRFCRITTVRTSVVHGISTFLVICYAKCVKTSLDLLIPTWLRKSGFNPPPRVWLNGELLYFSTGHLPYALPAIFCLLTIGMLPPGLLLAYPLGNKVMTFFGCDQVKFIAYFSQFLSIGSIN